MEDEPLAVKKADQHHQDALDASTVSSSCIDEESDGDQGMPLFKYARLIGSLPRAAQPNATSEGVDADGQPTTSNSGSSRAFSSPCTCSTMGKVILAPDVLENNSDTALSKRQSDLVWKYPHHVIAMGFETGLLSIVDARTGVAIAKSRELREYSVSSMVAVSFDASGAFLAALYANGMCTVWELRYAAARPTTTTSTTSTTTTAAASSSSATTSPAPTSSQAPPPNNAFTSFLTGFKNPPPPPPPSTMSDSSHHDSTAASRSSTIPSIKTTSLQATRVPYPSSCGRPTCMAIDPAYKRNREKVLLVGFRDGRLVMTKRGFLMRRNDYPICQGSSGPIEAIAWRGHLAAWADESGIKLFDTDTATRIAHVARPSGARAALYPTISSLRPTLCFETSENLLCAWGDCLMTLSIKERLVSKRNLMNAGQNQSENDESNGVDRSSGQQQRQQGEEVVAEVVKRRTVECTLAWELDCVACGVVPLDADHVAILGLVPIMDDENGPQNIPTNDLELQVMSRQQGTVIYADALPLIQSWNHSGKDAASCFSLLSSFALPRMEDTIEVREEKFLNADDSDDQDMDFQMPLFSSSKSEPFKDTHTKWSLEQLNFEEEFDYSQNRQADTNSNGGKDEALDDNDSIDSDDYSFVLRPSRAARDESVPSSSTFPPLMVVVSPSDAVLVSSREVDDAVSYALSAKKYGLALRRALTYKRQLRQYDINNLIDEYLRAVLRMDGSSKRAVDAQGEVETSLSIRRVILAAKAMPMLLGGKVQVWERWITEFSKIPGGLFVLREHLPVRDPVLPPAVYEAVLQTMLYEIEEVLTKQAVEEARNKAVFPQMMSHFLSTLIAWGPTRSLREKIRLCKYSSGHKRTEEDSTDLLDEAFLTDVEQSLERRLHQTSSSYLRLLSPSNQQQIEPDLPPNGSNPTLDDTSDSLFSVDDILSKVSVHVPLFSSETSESFDTAIADNHAALEAMAEMYTMKGNYKMSLKCFLAIGCLHVSPDVSSVEEKAITAVNGSAKRHSVSRPSRKYGFVLAMIEYQHLHQCLIDDTFLSSSVGEERRELSNPLVALMQLVGLDSAGEFLVEHCAPPPVVRTPNFPLYHQTGSVLLEGKSEEKQIGNQALPINLVADQLRPYPKLLHWYLHQIFEHKPEMYVKFPRTAVPPRPVTELHRSHLELHIELTDKRDSARALSGVETYNLEHATTPLLSFLKAALPVGGIRPEEARRILEAERSGKKQGLPSDTDTVKYPHRFALELAYVVEHFGKDTQDDAKHILDLYLYGCKSLMLAVSFAQRSTTYSSQLWAILIDHCLTNAQADDGDKKDGSLFGSLLECAALSGADNLAHLVTQIPQGMNVEGLRPRLVAAVADYRWKLKMHEAASSIGTNERIVLLRELAHRSRRGTRICPETKNAADKEMSTQSMDAAMSSMQQHDDTLAEGNTLISPPRPVERPNRYRLSFAVPIR